MLLLLLLFSFSLLLSLFSLLLLLPLYFVVIVAVVVIEIVIVVTFLLAASVVVIPAIAIVSLPFVRFSVNTVPVPLFVSVFMDVPVSVCLYYTSEALHKISPEQSHLTNSKPFATSQVEPVGHFDRVAVGGGYCPGGAQNSPPSHQPHHHPGHARAQDRPR